MTQDAHSHHPPRRGIRAAWVALFILALTAQCATAMAKEVIPPKPANRFNDYVGIVSDSAAAEFNHTLAYYEQVTSNVVLVVVYPTMQSDSDMADYCTRVAQKWKPGAAGKNNGVVLFIFVDDRKMYIATGYGLEANLPDVVCKRIIAEDIQPPFEQKHYAEAIRNAINVIGVTASPDIDWNKPPLPPESKRSKAAQVFSTIFVIILFLIILMVIRALLGIFASILASIGLGIFYHDRKKRTSRVARGLMWIEKHGEVNSAGSGTSRGYSHSSSYRRARPSAPSRGLGYGAVSFFVGSVIAGGIAEGLGGGGGGGYSSGGSFGGGGASGSW